MVVQRITSCLKRKEKEICIFFQKKEKKEKEREISFQKKQNKIIFFGSKIQFS